MATKIRRVVSRAQERMRRHVRVRRKVSGSAERPRLVVFRSLKHMSAQLGDDTEGRTLLTVTDAKFEGSKTERASQVGKLLAERATEAGFKTVVFDRAGYKYHGRVKAVADGAREGGLEF